MLGWLFRSHRVTRLRQARERALQRLSDAKARRDTRDIHRASQAVREATHALMRQEVR